jgi:MYXO-CTERM domain-containing protein
MLAVAGALAVVAGSASAAPILSFGYTELAGSYDSGSGAFAAVAVDDGALSTAGDVSRLAAPGSTANFNAGFVSRSSFADVVLNLDVTNVSGGSADGAGSITLTDDDGDTFTADVTGTFTDGGSGFYFFTGLLANASFSGSSFDGTDGGSFSTDLPGDPPYDGALVQVYLDGAGGFFTHDFSGVSVQADGEIVPTPGSLALIGLAGLTTARRRRH